MEDEKVLSTDNDNNKENDRIEELLAKIEAKFENSITGATGRVSKQFKAQIAALQEELAKIKEEKDAPSVKTEGGESKTEPEKTEPDPEVAKLRKQIEAMQAELKQTQKSAEQERENARRIAAEANAAQMLADKVTNPRHFLTIAQQDGKIEYKDGQFVRNQKDRWGNVSVVPISEGDYLSELTKNPDYAYFAKPRPGTGMGANNGVPTPQEKTFFTDNPDSKNVSSLAFSKGENALLQELLNS